MEGKKTEIFTRKHENERSERNHEKIKIKNQLYKRKRIFAAKKWI